MGGSRAALLCLMCAPAMAAGCGRLGYDALFGAGGDAGPSADALVDIGDDNVVFLSSFMILPGELGGVEQADERCTAAANEAGLAGDFVAFLSSTSSAAASRLGQSRGWRRPDGLPVADRLSDLAGGLIHAINMDETGQVWIDRNMPVITATAATGALDDSQGTCGDWTSTDGTTVTGEPGRTSSLFADGGIHLQACARLAHVYCFGTRSTAALDPAPLAGRVAFVSVAIWGPGAGLASADAVCQTEADAAGLSGTYLALLPTDTASAASRFDLAGARWVRTDGALLAATPTDLMTSRLATTFDLTATGAVDHSTYAWTGITEGGTGTMPGLATCLGWESSSSEEDGATLGEPWYAGVPTLTGDSGARCDRFERLYCLEQ